MTARFIVTSAEGFTIEPDRDVPQRPATRSFAVLDTAYSYDVVAEFHTGASKATEERNGRLAQALCDELNEWAAEHGTEPVPEFGSS